MDRSRPMPLPALMAALALVLAACAGGEEPTPTAAEPTQTAAAEASPSPTEAEQTQDAEPTEEAGEEEPEQVTMRIDGSVFDPAVLTIAAGTEVRFVNADAFAHTVTEGSHGQVADDPIIDEQLDQNGATSVTFTEAGTYEITCRIHPSMHMTITVEG
ncbi:MAG: cupredoxin domain-containing protein [Candidatus Limnocylindria bacterium]